MKSRAIVYTVALLAVVQLVQSAALNQEDVSGGTSQITIAKLGGASQRVDFSETDTVGQLRAKISQVDGTPASNLILVFAGKQLTDNSKLLTEYGIQQDSKVIFLQRPAKSQQEEQQQPPPPQEELRQSKQEGPTSSNGGEVQPTSESAIESLFVRATSGEIFEVPADAELTVGQLKHVIGLLINAPAESIHLEFNGAPLDDKKSLFESGLRNESAVTMTINQAAVQAQTAVLERVIRRIVESLVDKLNNNGQPRTKLSFQHDSHFTELEIVMQMIGDRILAEFKRAERQTPLILEAYRSKNLRLEFGYEFRGERKSTLANLNDGAQWVVEQAKAAVAIETDEVDQSEKEVFGDSSTSSPGPL